MTGPEIRLQKYLAECGLASRRKAEEFIRAGKVKVNGQVTTLGDLQAGQYRIMTPTEIQNMI